MENISRKLDYDRLRNIRDLGGMRTHSGRRIREGKLIRCGHLANLTPEDSHRLERLLDVVIDFRTEEECAEQPDCALPGVDFYHFPAVSSLSVGMTREEESYQALVGRLILNPEGAKSYMCSLYRNIAESDMAQEAYRRFLHLLLEERPGAVLWHCTAGKDRAGIASALIEEILGVPREAIFDDYLRTNVYLEKDRLKLMEMILAELGEAADREAVDASSRYLFGADASFIENFYETVSARFGSIEDYLREVLGVTDEDRARLQALYLE